MAGNANDLNGPSRPTSGKFPSKSSSDDEGLNDVFLSKDYKNHELLKEFKRLESGLILKLENIIQHGNSNVRMRNAIYALSVAFAVGMTQYFITRSDDGGFDFTNFSLNTSMSVIGLIVGDFFYNYFYVKSKRNININSPDYYEGQIKSYNKRIDSCLKKLNNRKIRDFEKKFYQDELEWFKNQRHECYDKMDKFYE